MESLNKKIKIISQEINNKKKKLADKNLILSDFVGEINSLISKINNLKKKSAFEISVCATKKCKLNPTNRKLPIKSKTIRRKQTMDSSMAIRGVTVFNKTPALEGILGTLQYKFKTENVAKKTISERSALSNTIRKKVITKWNRDFYSSNENELRSVNARKYLSLRKANKQAKFDNTYITNFVSYKALANRINNVDIGELNDISGLSASHEKVCGKYRNPASCILDLAKLYIEVGNGREDKLKTFESFSKKDASFFFVCHGNSG